MFKNNPKYDIDKSAVYDLKYCLSKQVDDSQWKPCKKSSGLKPSANQKPNIVAELTRRSTNVQLSNLSWNMYLNRLLFEYFLKPKRDKIGDDPPPPYIFSKIDTIHSHSKCRPKKCCSLTFPSPHTINFLPTLTFKFSIGFIYKE